MSRRQAGATALQGVASAQPVGVGVVALDDMRSSASSSPADSRFAARKRQPQSRTPRQQWVASVPTRNLSVLARNRPFSKQRAASAIAQEEAPRIEARDGPAMAETHRRLAMVTRFCL